MESNQGFSPKNRSFNKIHNCHSTKPGSDLIPLLLTFQLHPTQLHFTQVSHTNTLATTLPPVVAPASLCANPSHSYLSLFLISPFFNRLRLLSSFLSLKYPYLTSTTLLLHPPFLNQSPFSLRL